MHRQPVEQLGVARQRAAGAKVLAFRHQTASEKHLPQPVDRDPGDERILATGQPAGVPEPVLRGNRAASGRERLVARG